MIIVGVLLGFSIFALAAAPNVVIALGAMVAVGAFSSAFQLLNNVNLMRVCAPEFYGRVMSVTMMSFGMSSIASYPIGVVADSIGERASLVACGIGALLVITTGYVAMRRTARPAAAAPAIVPVIEEVVAAPGR